MHTQTENDFSQGSVRSNILRLAGPMTLAQLINLLYNIIDRMYIGHLPKDSTLALTGLGLTFPILMMITAFTNLFGMGERPFFPSPGENRTISGFPNHGNHIYHVVDFRCGTYTPGTSHQETDSLSFRRQ